MRFNLRREYDHIDTQAKRDYLASVRNNIEFGKTDRNNAATILARLENHPNLLTS